MFRVISFIGAIIISFVAGYFFCRQYDLISTPSPAGSISQRTTTERVLPVSYVPDSATTPQRNNTIVRAVQKASASVVFIGVTQIRIVNNPFFDDPFFRQFFPPSVSEYRSMGSGVIVTDKGHIVTNYHVVQNATTIEVHLADGRKAAAQVLGADPYTDLAIIKIEGKDYPAISVCLNDSLYIGEWAIAIGNPFGALIRDNRPTVTTGVISAAGREFTRESGIKYNNMIQTDAAINPGNSGGALINCLGELIGINTFIISPSGTGNIGMGFAIPAGRAMKTLKEIIQFGKIRSFYTGISIQDINQIIAHSLGLRSAYGVIVSRIEKNSPGAKAGLKVGDIILKVNNKEALDEETITDAFNQFLPGDRVSLTVFRDGKEKEIKLLLESQE